MSVSNKKEFWKWGIWGVGAMAQGWVRDLFLCERAIVGAVGGRTLAKATEFAAMCSEAQGPEFPVKAHQSLKDLCEDPNVEVVYIATPNFLHAKDVKFVLEAKKHVLVEKPFTVTLKEALEIQELSKVSGCFCMEAMWMRFIPMVLAAKKMLSEGTFGNANYLEAEFGIAISAETHARQFVPLSQGGGAGLDLGVYPISFASYLFGEPLDVKMVSTYSESVAQKDTCDTNTVFICRHAGNKISKLTCSFDHTLENKAKIYTNTHEIELVAPFYKTMNLKIREKIARKAPAGKLEKMQYLKKKALRKYFDMPIKNFHGPFAGTGYQFQIQHVMECLDAGKVESEIMPISQSVEVMKILDKLQFVSKVQ